MGIGEIPKEAFLVGERVYLRALNDVDAEGSYAGWFNDDEVCRGNSHHVFPYSRELALTYIRDIRFRRDCLVLAICVREDNRHIGNIALQAIEPISRSAEFAIVIGDRAAWGSGYGTEAGRLLISHGFRALNLHRIYCGTFEINEGMRRLALHLGMREEGRRRESAFKNGRFVDMIEYGMLHHEMKDDGTPGTVGR